jgi:hypothetical protein
VGLKGEPTLDFLIGELPSEPPESDADFPTLMVQFAGLSTVSAQQLCFGQSRCVAEERWLVERSGRVVGCE